MIKIPITNQPNQSFSIKIPLTDRNVHLAFDINWNSIGEYWVMSVTDADTDTEYISNLPMLTGAYPAANLLRQFGHLDIGAAYIISLSSATSDYPGEEDWGDNFVLLWGDDAE